jgi:hypothetical protein
MPVGNRANGGNMQTRETQLDQLIIETHQTISHGDSSAKMQGQLDALQSVRKLWCGQYIPMRLPHVNYTQRHRLPLE